MKEIQRCATTCWVRWVSVVIIVVITLSACEYSDKYKYAGDNLYEVASLGVSREAAVRLIKQGAIVNEVNPVHGWTPLHVAAANGHPKMVLALIDNGAQIDAQDHDGNTPLHLASGGGHDETIRVLMAHGADASLKNIRGETADDRRTLD